MLNSEGRQNVSWPCLSLIVVYECGYLIHTMPQQRRGEGLLLLLLCWHKTKQSIHQIMPNTIAILVHRYTAVNIKIHLSNKPPFLLILQFSSPAPFWLSSSWYRKWAVLFIYQCRQTTMIIMWYINAIIWGGVVVCAHVRASMCACETKVQSQCRLAVATRCASFSLNSPTWANVLLSHSANLSVIPPTMDSDPSAQTVLILYVIVSWE